MDRTSVETGCDAPEVFELVEAAFDGVADFVGLEVVWDGLVSSWVTRYDRFRADVRNQRAQGVRIISFVSQDPAGRQSFEQGRCERRVTTLTGREDEAQGSAKSVDGHMDLGCQSSSGTPQSLVPPFWPPPLPVAACW